MIPFRRSRPNRWSNGPTGQNRVALTQVARVAAERLFASLDMPATYNGTFAIQESRWADPLSILPFTGQKMAGSLLFTAPLEVISASSPSPEHDLENLIDWSRELANLLVGNLKTSLLRQGVGIELGIPTSVIGGDVRVALPGESAVGLSFQDGPHSLRVVLDAYMDKEVVIREEDDEPLAAEESDASFDMMLF